MTTVNNVSFKGLSPTDITRMPANAVNAQQTATTDTPADAFVKPKKMSTLTKVAIGVAATAAALVGLKYLGRNSFLKFDANGTGFMNAVKKYTMTAADYIEKPFVWTYKKIAGLFSKKAPDAAAQAGADAAAEAAQAVA